MSENNIDKIHRLEKIRNQLLSMDSHDSEQLKTISADMDGIFRDITDPTSDLQENLSLCLEGLYALSESTISDFSQLSHAISDALETTIAYLSEKPGEENILSDANRLLRQAIHSLIDGEDGVSDEIDKELEPLSELSMNDAAAILIQIEPDDIDEWRLLSDLLITLSEKPECTAFRREKLQAAIKIIQEIIDGASTDTEAAILEIGHLFEEIMHEIHKVDEIEPDADVAEETPDDSGGEESLSENESDEPAEETASADEKPPESHTPSKKNDEPAVSRAYEASPDEALYLPSDADADLIEAFITESSELIAKAEDALLLLENDPDNMDAVGIVFRAFHTIKGTSAFLELTWLSEMAHQAESLLSRIRDREIQYNEQYSDLALSGIDMLKELIISVKSMLDGEPFIKPANYDRLLAMLANPEACESIDDDEAPPPIDTAPPTVENEAEPEDISDVSEIEAFEKPDAELTNEHMSYAPDTKQDSQIEAVRHMEESSVRVPVDRLDRFVDMVGELVVAHSMVSQDKVVMEGSHYELVKKVSHMSKIVRELQHMSMSMRMIPLRGTFRKMARLVRDLGRKAGKKITFVTEGEDTEIDRNMVDIINDPLVHMVRNAVDHGIELPHIREQKGKPGNGTIQLSAYHSAGSVVVEIRDDGKGLNREKILMKAIERGLIEDTPDLYEKGREDRDIFSFIFEPGFTTAQTVSDLSGRGVGMDVVKTNIEMLRGQIDIQSALDEGSVFKISLPLTLAIIDGMVVRVGQEKYVMPTVSIIRSIQPEPDDISSILNRGEVVSHSGRLIPLFRLGKLFEIEDAVDTPQEGIVVIVESEGKQAGLLIDELIGSQQIVIKTLGEAMKNIPGISGSAIMPNGRVGLILDVGGLVKLANTRPVTKKGRVDKKKKPKQVIQG